MSLKSTKLETILGRKSADRRQDADSWAVERVESGVRRLPANKAQQRARPRASHVNILTVFYPWLLRLSAGIDAQSKNKIAE